MKLMLHLMEIMMIQYLLQYFQELWILTLFLLNCHSSESKFCVVKPCKRLCTCCKELILREILSI